MLTLRWATHSDDELIARTRMLSYAAAPAELSTYIDGVRTDIRAGDGDYLLALDGAEGVGTATSMSLTMWVRGSAVPCQGVAYVGTIHTRRRRTGTGSRGVATQLMHETLRLGRERGQVLSALMPFRASFYQHFGYGIVERRQEWTLPLRVLPTGDFSSLRYVRDSDAAAVRSIYQRYIERGQCGVARAPARWNHLQKHPPFEVIDPRHGYLSYTLTPQTLGGSVQVQSLIYEDTPALLRQLHFLAALHDQCSAAVLTLPTDVPLDRLLREPQIPHRPVTHATASPRPYTRMQARVLDHKKLLESLHLPAAPPARVVVAVHECEGHTACFSVDMADGRIAVSPSSATPQAQCPDHVWAALALGELSASTTLQLGLLTCTTPAVAAALDVLSHGPRPFCDEYF